jgi:hypothetical protein
MVRQSEKRVKGNPASLHARENGQLRERLTEVYAPGKAKVLRSISQGILAPQAMAFDASGDLCVSKDLDGPQGIAFDCSGNLYVASFASATVTVYAPGSSSPMLTINIPDRLPAQVAIGP